MPAQTLTTTRPVPTVFRTKEIADTFQRAAKLAAEEGIAYAVFTGPEGQVYCDSDITFTSLDTELGWSREAIAYPSTAFAGGLR